MDDIMLKSRKANVEEYKRYAKDDAYYQGMFDLMKRMIEDPQIIQSKGVNECMVRLQSKLVIQLYRKT